MNYYNVGDITPRQMQIFLTAAETENFSETAQKLNITQPYVSNVITRLEQTVDFPLFVRDNRKLYLTDAGHLLAEKWKDVFAQISQGVDEAHRLHVKIENSLRIADKCGLNKSMYLYKVAEKFCAEYPNVDITVDEFIQSQGLELVSSGKKDIGFCLLPEMQENEHLSNVSWKILETQPMRAIVPAGFSIYQKKSITLEELADIPIFLCDPSTDPQYNKIILDLFAKKNITPVVHSYAKDGISLTMASGFGKAVTILSPFSGSFYSGLQRIIPILDTESSLVVFWNNKLQSENKNNFLRLLFEQF